MFLFVCMFLVFQNRVSLCSPDCFEICFVDQAGLNSQVSLCLCLQRAEMKGMDLYAWIEIVLLILSILIPCLVTSSC